MPLPISLEKKYSSGKFPCNLLESQRLPARKLKLLQAVERVSAAVKAGGVETLVAVGDVPAAAEVVAAVEAAV